MGHWTSSAQYNNMANTVAKGLMLVCVAVAVVADPEPEPGRPKGVVSYQPAYHPAPVVYQPAPVYRTVVPIRRVKTKGFKAPKAPKFKAPKAPKFVRVARPVYRPAPVYSHGYHY